GSATGLMPDERLLRVEGRIAHQLCALTTLRDGELYSLTSTFTQPFLKLCGIIRQPRHDDATRHVHTVAIRTLQHLVDEFRAGNVEFFLDRGRAHTAYAAPANHELLHGRGKFILGDAEQISIL